MKNIKICIISSPGGHFYKTHLLKPWWSQYDRFWITKKSTISKNILKSEKIFFGHFPENRNIINFIKNFFLAFKILLKEKPQVLFSTGAGIAPPFFIVGKILGIKTIFMETFIFVSKSTLSGKIIYLFTDEFFVQNKKLLKQYPKAKYVGPIIWF